MLYGNAKAVLYGPGKGWDDIYLRSSVRSTVGAFETGYRLTLRWVWGQDIFGKIWPKFSFFPQNGVLFYNIRSRRDVGLVMVGLVETNFAFRLWAKREPIDGPEATTARLRPDGTRRAGP